MVGIDDGVVGEVDVEEDGDVVELVVLDQLVDLVFVMGDVVELLDDHTHEDLVDPLADMLDEI